MTEEIRIKTRDWERLLSPVQQEKYKLAIKQGWFANYHDNAWRHNTFYGAYIWKYPKFIKVVRMFEELLGTSHCGKTSLTTISVTSLRR